MLKPLPTKTHKFWKPKKNKPLATFNDIIKLLEENDKMMLVHHLRVDVGFVKIEANNLHLSLYKSCPKGFRENLSEALSKLTNAQWNVINSEDESCKSIKKQEEELVDQIEHDIKNNPLVLEALKTFAGTEIDKIEINKKVI